MDTTKPDDPMTSRNEYPVCNTFRLCACYWRVGKVFMKFFYIFRLGFFFFLSEKMIMMYAKASYVIANCNDLAFETISGSHYKPLNGKINILSVVYRLAVCWKIYW